MHNMLVGVTLTPLKRQQATQIITGGCAAVLALTACQSPSESAPDQSVTTEYRQFANQPQPNYNDIPAVELDEPAVEEIEDHYFRYLGVRGATEFYMARTDHEEKVAQGLCFIAVDTEADDATTQCKGPDELDPMVIRVDTPVEAFLIPDDSQVDELPEGWTQVRTNVVVVTDPDVAPPEADILLPGSELPEEHTLQRN